jgi:hypothetical protein
LRTEKSTMIFAESGVWMIQGTNSSASGGNSRDFPIASLHPADNIPTVPDPFS